MLGLARSDRERQVASRSSPRVVRGGDSSDTRRLLVFAGALLLWQWIDGSEAAAQGVTVTPELVFAVHAPAQLTVTLPSGERVQPCGARPISRECRTGTWYAGVGPYVFATTERSTATRTLSVTLMGDEVTVRLSAEPSALRVVLERIAPGIELIYTPGTQPYGRHAPYRLHNRTNRRVTAWFQDGAWIGSTEALRIGGWERIATLECGHGMILQPVLQNIALAAGGQGLADPSRWSMAPGVYRFIVSLDPPALTPLFSGPVVTRLVAVDTFEVTPDGRVTRNMRTHSAGLGPSALTR